MPREAGRRDGPGHFDRRRASHESSLHDARRPVTARDGSGEADKTVTNYDAECYGVVPPIRDAGTSLVSKKVDRCRVPPLPRRS